MERIAIISDVYGNMTAYDPVLVDFPRDHATPPLRWWLDGMSHDDHDWLRNLPFSLELRTNLSRGPQHQS